MNAPTKTSFEHRVFRFASIVVALVSLALLPPARAVVPPPDGGYPNFSTAEGANALKNLTTGAANTAVGWFSLFGDTTASFNTGVGAGTLLFNNGEQNTAVGVASLLNNTTGSFNTATGVNALSSNTTGVSNNAFGWGALLSNTTGNNNSAIGVRALQSNTEGISNVAVGESALSDNTTGSNNIALGAGAGANVTTENNVICIGANVAGHNQPNSCYIGNIFMKPVLPSSATAVIIDVNGQLGTVLSSQRFKHDIKSMDKASESILALNPVTFYYKDDAKNTPCFGLIAEEVAEVNSDLVLRDEDGKPFTVRYHQINGMLLNEFLKEHRKVQALQATITELKSDAAKQKATMSELKKDVGMLTAQLKEQAAQIQKVSAQVGATKAPAQVASRN